MKATKPNLAKQIEAVCGNLKAYCDVIQQVAADEQTSEKKTLEYERRKKLANPNDLASVRLIAELKVQIELFQDQADAADEKIKSAETALQKALYPLPNLIRESCAPLREKFFQEAFEILLQVADEDVAREFVHHHSKKVRAVDHIAACVWENAILLSAETAAEGAINATQQLLEFEK